VSHIYEALQRSQDGWNTALTPPPRTPPPDGPRLRDPEPSSDDQALALRRLVWLLFKRKWEILLVTALVVIPVAVATYLAVPMYQSIAMVEVEQEPVQVLPYREIDLPRITPHYELFIKSQEQVLRSGTLVSRIAHRLRSEYDADSLAAEIPRLEGGLAIQRLEGTQIFLLGYLAPDPRIAARIANFYAEEYINLHYENRQATRQNARQLLQRELEGLEKRVQQAEKALVSYAQAHGIPATEQGVSLVQQKLSAVGGQLSQAETDLFVTQVRLEMLRNASLADFPEGLVTGVISGLMSRLVQLENELTVLRTKFGENWPAVVQKRTEITLAQDQLEREKATALAQAREQALLDYRAADNKRKLIASSLEQQKRLANEAESASVQYNILRREVETNRKMYEGMLQRLEQTNVTTGMEFGGIRITERAGPSRLPESPNVKWNLSLACLLGLGLGVCIAFARDFWDTSVSTIDELEQLTFVPVLGTVPQIPSLESSRRLLPRMRTRLAGDQPAPAPLALREAVPAGVAGPPVHRMASNAVAAEAVRNVCASILLSRSGRPPRVLMVTSAVTGEGKTTVVRELGQAFAEGGAKTLLVECDMRRPSFGSTFGVGSEGGLSLYLSGHVEAAPTIHPTSHSNLFVVAAGPPAPNPPALLNSDKLKSFLGDMTSSFRFIILDAPPALPLADARVLAPLAEGVILVVRAGLASKQMVRRVCAVLSDTGTNMLGAVLNGADPQDAGGLHYSYYTTEYFKN
jgi:polysaccharide biosynthesis transport protein